MEHTYSTKYLCSNFPTYFKKYKYYFFIFHYVSFWWKIKFVRNVFLKLLMCTMCTPPPFALKAARPTVLEKHSVYHSNFRKFTTSNNSCKVCPFFLCFIFIVSNARMNHIQLLLTLRASAVGHSSRTFPLENSFHTAFYDVSATLVIGFGKNICPETCKVNAGKALFCQIHHLLSLSVAFFKLYLQRLSMMWKPNACKPLYPHITSFRYQSYSHIVSKYTYEPHCFSFQLLNEIDAVDKGILPRYP